MGNKTKIEWTSSTDPLTGETTPGARFSDPGQAFEGTARRADCQASDVPVFVKQVGAKPIYSLWNGGTARGFPTDKKGGNIEEFPPNLQIRQFPKGATN